MTTRSSSANFNDIAQTYERAGEPTTLRLGVQALDEIDLQSGQSLIDVAAGTGGLAVIAAKRGIRVLATDVGPAMVQRAAERLMPFSGCEAKVMNLEALAVSDESFDAAISTFGVSLFETWHRGMSELVRVTRSGGPVAVVTWTDCRDASPALLMKRVFEKQFAGRELWPRDFFPHWSVDTLEAALRNAGCQSIETRIVHAFWNPMSPSGRPISVSEALDDGDQFFRIFPSYRDLTPAEHESLRRSFEAELSAYADAESAIQMPTEAFVAVGRKR